MPSKGDGAGTLTFRPHRAYGQLRNTENRQRLRGLAAASLMPHRRLIAVPPCSFSLLPDKDFTTTPPLAACFSSPRVETMIIRLPALSAYHRLALPGLVNSIKRVVLFDTDIQTCRNSLCYQYNSSLYAHVVYCLQQSPCAGMELQGLHQYLSLFPLLKQGWTVLQPHGHCWGRHLPFFARSRH